MKRVAVTGAGGLIGHHVRVRMHAANCAARHRGEAPPFKPVPLDRAAFGDDARLREALAGADLVIHLAGINRADDAELEDGNAALARRLAEALGSGTPHLVYANSLHAAGDSPYGRGKRRAGEILGDWAGRAGADYTNLTLPHIFGEGGRPFYNNVTGTFCHQAAHGEAPEIGDGEVELLHAGAAAETLLSPGTTRAEGRRMTVRALWDRIEGCHALYAAGIFPDVADPFDLALFNTYRAHLHPDGFPRRLTVHEDPRGSLFEAAKGGGGGQTFLSRTRPGVTRGDHFHLSKVERFLVIEGEATIRVRPVLSGDVWSCTVSGRAPAAVDMPTLHTHSIENTGPGPLITLFWANAIFDPADPDTYADPVLGREAA